MRRLVPVLITAVAMLLMMAPQAMAEEAAAPDGAALFKKKCKSCHGLDGTRTKAGEKKGAPEKLGEAVKSDSVSKIKKVIASGVRDDAGKKKMPGFAKKFTDAEIEAIARFVKTLK